MATGSAFLDVERITSISRESEGTRENNLENLEPYQKMLCDGWLSADAAYQNLRLCASESNLARTMISEKDKNGQDSSYSNANYNYNYNDSETIQTADGVAKAFAQQRQKQATCSVSALEGACLAFDNYKTEGIMAGPSGSSGWNDDFGHVAGGSSWTESGAVVVAPRSAIATTAAAALVNGFTVVALLFQMFD